MTAGLIEADWPAPPGIVAGTTLRNSEVSLPGVQHWLKQVHGATVVRWDDDQHKNGAPEADAIVASGDEQCCAVRTADCLPILFCSSDGAEVAAAHGGWRGLAAGIIESTLGAMSTKPADLIVWLGPAISQPAFEVGDEVREAFCTTNDEAGQAFEQNARGRWQADLNLLARQRLQRAGVQAIYGGGLCTYSDAERFYSYRRDGETGRLLSFVCRVTASP